MKKLLYILAAFTPAISMAALNNATTISNGNITTNSNWTYNTSGTTPTAKDTLYVYHDMFWNADVDWSGSSIDVIVIKSGGSIGPDGNNNELTLPSGITLIVETGGEVSNPSGNASNHAINFGSTCIWGKQCCVGNTIIQGPVSFDVSNPCGVIVLPVEIISIGSEILNNEVTIKWTVATESDIDYYRIDRTVDGKNYESVGTLDAINNSELQHTYRFTDRNPLPVKSAFYKLTSIDLIGQETGMNVINVALQVKVGVVFENSALTVSIANYDQTISMSIFDLQGKLLHKSECTNQSETDLSKIANSGMCILRLTMQDGTLIETQKLFL